MRDAKQDYQTLSARLDEVLAAMQAPNITVDEAITLHQEGAALVDALQKYLKDTENRVTKLNTKNT